MQPRITYIICSIERTGSYLLSDALRRTGIAGQPQEFFHPSYMAKLPKEAGEGDYAAYFKQIMVEGTTPNAVFGAKIHWSHMRDLLHRLRNLPAYSDKPLSDLLPGLFPNLRYIQITRRDTLRQAVSLLKARQTDVWWEMDAWVRHNRRAPTQVPTFDAVALDRIIYQIEAHEAAWAGYFKECGVQPFEVVYEELVHSHAQYEEIIRQVLHYLDISIPHSLTIPETRYKKQADDSSEEWVKRYLQLKVARTNAAQQVPEQRSSPAASILPAAISLRPLNIVTYATRPLGGAPLRLARCIDTCTPHTARCVWPHHASDYSTDYRDTSAMAEAQLATADVIIVFDGNVALQHRDLLSHKDPITFAYSYFDSIDTQSEQGDGYEYTGPIGLDLSWVRQGFPAAVLDQVATHPYFQAAIQDREHEGTNRAEVADRTRTTVWTMVPDPLPFWEEAYKPAPKADVLTVCYISPALFSALNTLSARRTSISAPTSTLLTEQRDDSIVLHALENLMELYPLRVVVFGPAGMAIRHDKSTNALTSMILAPPSTFERQALRRQAHIIIEDCASGGYHHASLAGLSTGSVVVNGVGLQPRVVELFRTCAYGCPTGDCSRDDSSTGEDGLVGMLNPFVHADVASLERVLAHLICLGVSSLEEKGRENRRWVEKHWDFATQWQRIWEPLIKRVMPPPVPGGKVVPSHSAPSVSLPVEIASASELSNHRAPSKSTSTISVVVISHNEGEYLHRTIKSLQSGLSNDSEIIVVDDCSTDGSTEELDNTDGCITVLRPHNRLGVAAARNFGARHAKGDIIVFSDAHVVAPSNWTTPLADALTSQEVGAVAPAISVMGRPAVRGYGGFVHAEELAWHWLGWKGSNPHQVPLLCGCFLAVRRDVLEATGGFDSGMITYGVEDTEFSFRLWLLGYECLVVPTVAVAHHFRPRNLGLPDYQRHWLPVIYNMLRLAVMHFGEDRIRRLVKQKVKNHAFPLALARVAAGDAWQRRSEMQALRRYDDDWFFRKFATAGKPR